MPALLELRGLRKTFGRGSRGLPAVRGVDLDVERGETVGVVGESGCGKTTLARMVAGLTPVTEGRHPLRRGGSGRKPRHRGRTGGGSRWCSSTRPSRSTAA